MSKQRYLDTKFWSDSYIEKLDPIEKLLFIYLMTNERTNLAGIYELPIKYMSVETGIERSMLENILSRFEKDNKIVLHDGWVRVVNAIKHQNLSNSKIQLGIEKILSEVPIKIRQGLKLDSDDLSMTYVYPIDETSHTIQLNTIQSNNNITKLEKREPEAVRLAEKLHAAVKERYNFTKQRPNEIPNSAYQIELLHRVDGYDYALIEKVLDWSQQDQFWQQNIRSGNKLRLKFEELLIKIKSDIDKRTSRVVVAGQDG